MNYKKSILAALSTSLSMLHIPEPALGSPLGLNYIRVKNLCSNHDLINMVGAPTRVLVKVAAETLQPGGKVTLQSTNPRIFPLPPSTQILGLGFYNNVYVDVKEPHIITPVQVMGSMLPRKIDLKTEPIVVYPRLKIVSFQLSPRKRSYKPGEQVTAIVKLNYKPPEKNNELHLVLRWPVANNGNSGIRFPIANTTYSRNLHDWQTSDTRSTEYRKTFTIGNWPNVGPYKDRQSLSFNMEAILDTVLVTSPGSTPSIIVCSEDIKPVANGRKQVNISIRNPSAVSTPLIRPAPKPKRAPLSRMSR